MHKTCEPGQEVTSPLEVVGGRDGSGRDEEHSSREIGLFRPLYVHAHVLARQDLADVLVENLHVGHARLPLVAEPHNLQAVLLPYATLLDCSNDDGAPALHAEDIVDGHDERRLRVSDGDVDVGV